MSTMFLGVLVNGFTHIGFWYNPNAVRGYPVNFMSISQTTPEIFIPQTESPPAPLCYRYAIKLGWKKIVRWLKKNL